MTSPRAPALPLSGLFEPYTDFVNSPFITLLANYPVWLFLFISTRIMTKKSCNKIFNDILRKIMLLDEMIMPFLINM